MRRHSLTHEEAAVLRGRVALPDARVSVVLALVDGGAATLEGGRLVPTEWGLALLANPGMIYG